MKKLKTIQCLLAFTALALWVPGCATPNVNPPQAQANTGYVDFHPDAAEELWWEVSRFEETSQSFRKVFSEFDPPTGGILRLAFAPGRHRMRVTFLNRAILKPAEIEVEVLDGKVTPVRIAMTEIGSTSVRTVEQNRGGTVRGRYGRRTRIGSDETITYDLSAVATAPVTYQRKEQMPYAR